MISENKQQSKKVQLGKGNWEPSADFSYPENFVDSIQPQFPAKNTNANSDLRQPEKQTKKDPRDYAQGFTDKNIGNMDFLEYQIDEYINKPQNPMQFILQRAANRSFEEETLFSGRGNQIILTKEAFASMTIPKHMEENFISPRKSKKNILIKPSLETNSRGNQSRDLDAKFDLLKTDTPHQLKLRLSDTKTLTGLSTGISGSESTPSNSSKKQRNFKIPNAIDLIVNDSSNQHSDAEFKEAVMKSVVVEESEMDCEDFPKSRTDLQAELENFNPIIEPCGIDNDTIVFLIQQEKLYSPDPRYLKTNQPYLTWLMRAILVDWMFEVCMEFTLKRETFHFALNYVDRFLSIYSNVQKQELQLIGVAALFIAAKTEEIFSFSATDFAKSCDGAYTVDQIIQVEAIMLRTLKWMLVPPTLNTWAQWYLSQWDLYIEKSPYALSHPLIISLGKEAIIQFRQPNEKSYMLFRELMQYIDCITLDIEHYQYNKRTLIASLIYLIVGQNLRQFTLKQITEEFQSSSIFLLNKQNLFNNFFSNFLEFIVGFRMEEVLPSVQYVAPFFKLPLVFELPRAIQLKGTNLPEGNFEEFLSYQTHDLQALPFMKNKAKGMI